MKAGRELDALVAEKVMGLTEEDWIAGPTGLPRPYSTDIAAAWEVVEKLRGTHRPFLLSHDFQDGFMKWPVVIVGFGAVVVHEGQYGAPHAICLAALKAVGAL